MRDVVDFFHRAIDSFRWLLAEAWQLALSATARVAGVWPHGQPAKQIAFLVLLAALACAAFFLARRLLKAMQHAFSLLACLVAFLMTVGPTIVITFLALAGGVWLAKSF
jgi:hypothetical protein